MADRNFRSRMVHFIFTIKSKKLENLSYHPAVISLVAASPRVDKQHKEMYIKENILTENFCQCTCLRKGKSSSCRHECPWIPRRIGSTCKVLHNDIYDRRNCWVLQRKQ